MRKFLIPFFILFFVAGAVFAQGGTGVKENSLSDPIQVYFFGRDDCKFCSKEKNFLEKLLTKRSDFEIVYHNIADSNESKLLFNKLTESKDLPKVTPITLIGKKLIQGFDSVETTGVLIIRAIEKSKNIEKITVENFISSSDGEISGSTDSSCDSFEVCDADEGRFLFTLPVVGAVDLESFSLFSLSTILGFVDGFNPCAMWVLITFLLILLQVKDKRKMWQVAGLFIAAEALMYFMILNVWYKTWDFVGLDMIVTPLIGILAIGGGVYFLNKYFKNRKNLVCDITSIEYQQGIEGKIKKLVHSPFTIVTAIGVIGIALSVNVIEFACSIGIPQAYTKILELNSLSFASHQFYLLVYTLFYMLDDLIVFGLALYSFDKLHTSYKYANFSALVGGILMLILGAIMLFAPNILIF
jgi:glutaredoxin